MSIDMQVAVNTFLMEGRELAHELEDGLLQLEQGHDPRDRDLINAMFRAATPSRARPASWASTA